jgi:uncharacterized repeat protein (TIGR01451 family)
MMKNLRLHLALLCLLLSTISYSQNITAIAADSAYQGQSLKTTITSTGVFMTASSPQGNIQEILLRNATDSVFAVSDSTAVINTNTATTFWNVPVTIATGVYDLVVRIYDLVTFAVTEKLFPNGFHIFAPTDTISGYIYNDANGNGTKDAGEAVIAGRTVHLNPGNKVATSDATGKYIFGTTNGTYTVKVDVTADDLLDSSGVGHYTIIATGSNYANNNFGLVKYRYLTSMTPTTAAVGTTNDSITISSSRVFKNATIQNVLLKRNGSIIYSSNYMIMDTNKAVAYFNIPAFTAGGKYDLLVKVQNTITNKVRDFVLDTAFMVTGPKGCIEGYVYVDSNANGVKDANEKGTANVYVYTSSNVFNSTYTDSTGHYTFCTVPPGTYTVGVYNPYSYYGCSGASVNYLPANYSVTSNNDTILGKNFGSTNTATQYDLAVYPIQSAARPGFETIYYLYYSNFSKVSAGNAVITMVYDSTLVYDSARITPTTINTTTHTLTWNIGALPAYTYYAGGYYDGLYAYFKVPVGTALGKSIVSTLSIKPDTNDCSKYNNIYNLFRTIGGSYDPNELSASPIDSLQIGRDSIIDYTIQFQNTGTDTTQFVTVYDTLSSNLVYQSVIITGSSNPVDLDNSNGILKFTFNPLHLVDSTTNEKMSHGSVSFRVKVKSGLPAGTVIKNVASIYFDYNTPIRTNFTKHTIYKKKVLGLDVVSSYSGNVTAAPNPFSTSTSLSFTNNDNAKHTLMVYDISGKLVETLHTTGSQFMLHRDGKPAGVYLYRLVNEATQSKSFGKLTVIE